jgi:phosphatidate phosphatase APP1
MRARVAIALALLVPVAGIVATSGEAEAQSGGPAWYDTDLPFRVVVEAGQTTAIPQLGANADSDLVGYEIAFADALERAGWPDSLVTESDPGSLVVVPYETLRSGAPAGEPVPITVGDPISTTGTCEAAETARCLVAWERVPSARAYGLYWAPAGADVDLPEVGEGPDLVGTTMGQEHWAMLRQFEQPELFVHPAPEEIRIDAFTTSGLQTVYDGSGGNCVEEDDLLVCDSVPTAKVRVLASEPTTLAVSDGASNDDVAPVSVPLAGTQGQVDDTLRGAIPEGPYDTDPELVVWAHNNSCGGGCDVSVSPASQSDSSFTLTSSAAQTVELSTQPDPQAVQVDAPDGERVHAALRGPGFTPIDARQADRTNIWLPVDSTIGFETPDPTTVDLNDISRSTVLQEDREVDPPLDQISLDPDTDTLEVVSEDPIRAYAGSITNLDVDTHQPIDARERIPVPANARLVAIAPQLGGATQTVELEEIQGQTPSTNLLRLSATASRQVVDAGDEPSLVGVDTNGPVGFVVVAEQGTPLVGQGLGVRHPVSAQVVGADYLADAIDVTVTPQNAFAGSGSVVDFNITVRNLGQTESGATPSLGVDLSLDPIGTAEGNVSTTLTTSDVQLPGERGAERTVQFSARVDEGLSDVVLPVRVNATVEGPDGLTASDKSRISVVTIRDFQLTYADGSSEQTQTAQPGSTNTFELQVRNTGTVPSSIKLDQDAFGGEGFDVCLRSSGSTCSSTITLEDVQPGNARTAEVRVESPDKETEDRLELSIRGELADHAGPVRTVEGTVFLNVPVVAQIDTQPSRLQLAPGESETVSVTVQNQGVQSDARLTLPTTSSAVNATLVDPDTGEPNGTLRQLLGPRNTQAATWETQLRVEVDEDAPPGLRTEALLELRLQPGGGLPSFGTSSKVGVEVVRVLSSEPLNAPTIPPGTTSKVEVPLQLDLLSDSTVNVRLDDAPALWNITPPEELTFDGAGRGLLSFGAEPPAGAKAGNATVSFRVLDPLGPGGVLPVDLGVTRGGYAEIQTRERVDLAMGSPTVLPLTIRSVGNQPLSGDIVLEDEPGNLTLTGPPLGTLAAANGTQSLPATLVAREPMNTTVSVGVLDGNRRAGNASVDVRSARAEIGLGPNRIVPDEDPEAGEPYPVTVTVNNDGPVPVRNLTVALLQGDARVAERAIERLPAKGNATVTIEWLPQEDASRSDLTIQADPDGELMQDREDDAVSLEESNDAPAPGLLLTLIALGIPAGLKGTWKLFSRRERWVAIGGVVLLLFLVPALFVPAITVDQSPADPGTPEEVIDTDDDGVSDTAEVTRYGTDIENNDTDDDVVPDGWEAQHARFNETFRDFRPDPARADANEDIDGDGLTNVQEYRNDTDPHAPDTDDDGFPDGWEVRSGLDPTSPTDPDADCSDNGLTNEEEFERGTLACREDSDGDGIADQAEIDGVWSFGGDEDEFEPTDPAKLSTGGSGAADGWLIYHDLDPHVAKHFTADPDGDELSTTREWKHNVARGLTDPADWEEALDPTTSDTDGDGLPDGWEVRQGLDPLDPEDGNLDPDGDGLTNGQEFEAGTDPETADTDGDGLSDGEEVDGYEITVDGDTIEVQSNPLIEDTDGDGLSDFQEREGRANGTEFPATNPLSSDTDGDRLSDGDEVFALEPPDILDPTVSDTDNDGLLDGEEWDLWTSKAERARTDAGYAARIEAQTRRTVEDVVEILEPTGDLDDDGMPNILDPNADTPEDQSSLPEAEQETLKDGEEVFPPSRSGRTLPPSDPSLRDTDGDELPDSWEREHTQYSTDLGGWLLDPRRADSDGNGVPDNEEDMETNCYGSDAGGDGVPWWDEAFTNELELERGTDPLDCDTDDDGLPDGWEVEAARRAQGSGTQIQLNPGNADSDGDGTPDAGEVSPIPVPDTEAFLWAEAAACTEDATRTGKGVCLYRWGEGVPDRSLDTDRTASPLVEIADDNCTPGQECHLVRATLSLGHEVELQTDPSRADTDGDGYVDAWEALHGLDPADASSPPPDATDPDEDELETADEYQAGTDPFNPDTDQNGRGLPDGVDVNPLDPTDDSGDCDWDGIDDPEEAQSNTTDAGTPDTDGDGLLDQTYNPDGCEVDGEVLREPEPGVDLIAIPNPNEDPDDPSDDFLGETTFGTKASAWETNNDDLPDGWKALYDLDPGTSHTTTDTDGDGLTDTDEYELGRPAWWDEIEHGAWWFGSDPLTSSTRDLDGDGLDDGLFDPEPLSPNNDCQLPEGWELPPAWDEAHCLSQEPSEDELEDVVRGLRQLAFDKVFQAEAPQSLRSQDDGGDAVEVHTEDLTVTPDVLTTGETFDVEVPLCAEDGDACTAGDQRAPLVGLYVVTQKGADPNPKDDPLLCVLDPADGGDDWVADTTSDGLAHADGADACSLEPGQRSLAEDTGDLVLAPHAHGTLRPGESWTVEADDIEPGSQLRLAAWPLPTKVGSTSLVADQTEEPDTPAVASRTPAAQGQLHLQGDPILEAEEEADVTVRLRDEAGFIIPNRPVEVSWNGEDATQELVDGQGRLNLTLDAIDTDEAVRIPLNVSYGGSGVVEGTEASFPIPVRIGSSLSLDVAQGTAPGQLPVRVSLDDKTGSDLAGRTVTASAELPGDTTSTANGTTNEDGNATIQVPLPAGTDPGQAKVTANFAGDTEAGASSAEGLADIRVQPRIELDAPEEVSLTDGVRVDVNLTLPNGDPVSPAPGEAFDLVFELGSLSDERRLVSAPPGGRVSQVFPSGPNLPLGTSELSVELREGRFNPSVTESDEVTVKSDVDASLSTDVLGVGVANNVTVEVRDKLGRPVDDVPVELGVREATATAETDDRGQADTTLELPLSAQRGPATAELQVEETNRTQASAEDVDVTVTLGTEFEVPAKVTGSLDGFNLQGRLVTATGEGIEEGLVGISGLGSLDIVTGPDGGFSTQITPPESVEPGNHTVQLAYEGEETLAPARAEVQVDLFQSVNLTVEEPPLVPVGGEARVTGELTSKSGPVEDARVQLEIGNRTAEATTGTDGTFTLQGTVPDGEAGSVPATVRVPRQQGLAETSRSLQLQAVDPVELTASKRSEDGGITVTVQAATSDGKPLAGKTIVASLPNSQTQLTTDENGIARYHLSSATASEGAQIEFVYQGSDTQAPASTSVELQSTGAPISGAPVGIAVIVLVIAVEGVILWRVYRRRKVVDTVVEAVQDLESRLRAGDELRAAVVHTFRRIQNGLEALGHEEADWETHREYLDRSFAAINADVDELGPFMDLLDRAQYGAEPMRPEDRVRALELSQGLLDELVRAPTRGEDT